MRPGPYSIGPRSIAPTLRPLPQKSSVRPVAAVPASRMPAPLRSVKSPRAGSANQEAKAAVVTLLAVCDSTHGKSYFDIVMVGIVGAIVALVAVIVLGTMFGSF